MFFNVLGGDCDIFHDIHSTGEQLAIHIETNHLAYIEVLMGKCAQLQLNSTKVRSELQLNIPMHVYLVKICT